MERKLEVKPVKIDFDCPRCAVGRLRPTGMCLPTSPPKYPHKCTYCEYGETFTGKQYPYIDYEPV